MQTMRTRKFLQLNIGAYVLIFFPFFLGKLQSSSVGVEIEKSRFGVYNSPTPRLVQKIVNTSMRSLNMVRWLQI